MLFLSKSQLADTYLELPDKGLQQVKSKKIKHAITVHYLLGLLCAQLSVRFYKDLGVEGT